MKNNRIEISIAENLVNLLESRFKIAGKSFGLDPILGLFPGLGDLISLVLGLYMVWLGKRLRLRPQLVQQMVLNLVIDWLIGIVPVVGDLVDFWFKANTKNWKIIEEELKGSAIEEGEIVG
ncbi:MAG: DUF4112 domain-containing protein [Candidatus Shapirobacteria bacterium]|jgi:hypothetical protein